MLDLMPQNTLYEKRPEVGVSNTNEWENYQAHALLWNEQRIQETQESARRHWWSLIAIIVLQVCMTCLMMCIIFKKQVAVIVAHHRSNASVWLSQVDKSALVNLSASEIKGNIAQYIQARESYSAMSYPYQYAFVKHASISDVFQAYEKSESYHRVHSKVRQDGRDFGRTVMIHDIMFLPAFKSAHISQHFYKQDKMADVSYRLCRHYLSDGSRVCVEKHALLAWHFRGIPADPDERWLNWRGFTVSYFHASVLSHTNDGFKHIHKMSVGGVGR